MMPYQERHVDAAATSSEFESRWDHTEQDKPPATDERKLIWTVGLTGFALAAVAIVIAVV